MASLCLHNYFSVLVTFLTSGRVLSEHVFVIRMVSGVPSLSTLWHSIFFRFSVVSHGLVLSLQLNPKIHEDRLTCDILCYQQCTQIELGFHRKCSENTCLNGMLCV